MRIPNVKMVRLKAKYLRLDQSQVTIFSQHLNNINSALMTSINLIDEFFTDDIEDQLNIKLPEQLLLSGLSDIISDLGFIFNKCQVISEFNNKEAIKVQKVDSGSKWLLLGISVFAVGMIGKLCTIAFGISQQVMELRKSIQQIRVLKSGANICEALEEELKERIKTLSDAESLKFIKENGIKTENGNEESNSLAKAIERLVELHFKGVEIYASLEAPKEVASSFPSQEEALKLATEILKLSAPTDQK